jgi:hypothetical protein
MATGVRQRHGLNCNRKMRCHCPWEASVYSKRDAKKIRKTFPTKAAALGSTMQIERDLRHLRGHRRDPAAGDRAGDLRDAHQLRLRTNGGRRQG